jgi:predicted nucleic acid-binding protein
MLGASIGWRADTDGREGKVRKLVWDTSALLNIKEPNSNGYSPGNSLMKDFSDGWLPGPYQHIFPSIAYFELQASISRKHRDGEKMLREFYLLDEHSMVYPIDQGLITKSSALTATRGFDRLRGADLIFACIAFLEGADLITLDSNFKCVADQISVVDLNESRYDANYRTKFRK